MGFEIFKKNSILLNSFNVLFILLRLVLFSALICYYAVVTELSVSRTKYGPLLPVSQASAALIMFELIWIVLSSCDLILSYFLKINFIKIFYRSTSFHKINHHKLAAISMFVFTIIHVVSHWINIAIYSKKMNGNSFLNWLKINFISGTGWSGYVMLSIFLFIIICSLNFVQKRNYKLFKYSHYLFILLFLFWMIHGNFCMIKYNSGSCSSKGYSWIFWIFGAAIFLLNKFLVLKNENLAKVTSITIHPEDVYEVQIECPNLNIKCGQYVLINCPLISFWSFHPFTATLIFNEANKFSLNVKVNGKFTSEFAKLFLNIVDKGKNVSEVLKADPIFLFIRGPFGTSIEDVFDYKASILVAGGIGATPFASLFNYLLQNPKKIGNNSITLYWVCDSFAALEWFINIIKKVENCIFLDAVEINIHITPEFNAENVNNIILQCDDEKEYDSITKLRAKTNFCRPHWPIVFEQFNERFQKNEAIGVFCCGPSSLSKEISEICDLYSSNLKYGPSYRYRTIY